jgi:hypothetical protein
MAPYGGPRSALTIALPGGLYIAFIKDRYRGPQTSLAIALPGCIYLAIIMGRYIGSKKLPCYTLAWSPLISNYNGLLWRAQNCLYYSLA